MRVRLVTRLLAPWLLLLPLLVGGCEKRSFTAVVEQTPWLGLPPTIEQLHVVDLSRLRTRQGFMLFVDNLEEDNTIGPALAALREKVGFDPFEQVDALAAASIGLPATNEPLSDHVYIARGRFEEAEELLPALRQWLADEVLVQPPAFQSSVHPDTEIKVWRTRGQSQYNVALTYEIRVAFPTPSLAVLGFSAGPVNEVLDVVAGKTQGIQRDKPWLERIARADTASLLWGAGKMDAGALRDLPAGAVRMAPAIGDAIGGAREYFYSLEFGEGLEAIVGLFSPTIEAATQLTATVKEGLTVLQQQVAPALQPTLPETAKVIGRIHIATELQTTRISLKVPGGDYRLLLMEWERAAQ